MATASPTPHHNYWSTFAATTDLPNVAGSSTQNAILEVGDTAFVIGSSTPYYCTDATLGAAVWASAGGGAAVVPRSFVVVGNSAEGDTAADCDYLDTGNGAQLAAAIAASIGKTIFIRPGTYDLNAVGAPSTPITVDRCRLIGAGLRVSFPSTGQGVWLFTKQTGNLRLFDFSSGVSGDPATDFAGMENIRIQAMPPTGAISGSSFIYRGSHKNVYIHLNTGTSGSYQWDNTHIGYAASLVAMFEEPYHAEDCYATTAPYNFNYWVGGRRISAFRYTSPGLGDIHGSFTRCSGVCADYGFYIDASGAILEGCYTVGSSSDVGGAGIYLGTSALFCRIVNGYFQDMSAATTLIRVNCGYSTISGNTFVGSSYILDFSSSGSNNISSHNTFSGGTVRFQAGANGNVHVGNNYASTLSNSGARNLILGQETIVVGNSAAGDQQAVCDYLDTGNGAQLFAAVAAHPAKTIFVRPGTYDLAAAGAPSGQMTINGKLIGSGNTPSGTYIKTRKTGGGDISIISGGGGYISDMRILIQTPTGTLAGTYLVSGASYERVVVIFEATWNATQLGYAGSLHTIFSGCSVVRDCILYSYFSFADITGGRQLSFLRDGSAGCKYQGCSGGGDYGVMCTGTSGALIYACSLVAAGVASKGIYAYSGCTGGRVTDCQIACAVISNTAKAVLIDSTANRWSFEGNRFSITNHTTGAYLVDCGGSYTRFDNNEFAGTAPSRFVAGGNYNRVMNSIRPDGSVWTDAGTLNSFIDDPINFSISPIGGMMVPIINNSGGTLLAGRVLSPDTANNYSGVLSPTSDFMPIGIVYADIANGATGWMVVAGYADVYFDNVGAISRKDWAGVSTTTAGACTASAGDPGASHWREVGHVMQAITGPGLARCIVHFN